MGQLGLAASVEYPQASSSTLGTVGCECLHNCVVVI